MKKRILSAILALALMLSLVPLTASAVEPNKCGDNLIYTLDGDTLTISGTGSMYDYRGNQEPAPWYTSGISPIKKVKIEDGVASIGNSAFSDCDNLTYITIPDSVTSIGSYTFYNCRSLTSVTIPDSVKSIGDGTFFECYSLTSITIPDSVTSIGSNAFAGSGLTSISIPDSVTSIGSSAFWECSSLTSITIPDSVTSIGSSAFEECFGLATVVFQGNGITVSNAIFNRSVTAYYPHGNTTWTEAVRKSYGYGVTWKEGCVKSGLDKLAYTTQAFGTPVPATCTKKGLSTGTKCSQCGEILVPQKETELAEHDYALTETKEATCTERAHDISECSGCHRTKVEYYGVLADHTAVDVSEVPATCAAAGREAGKICSVCDKILEGCQEIPAKKHTATAIDGSKATLTAGGVKAHYECDNCGGYFTDKECTQAVSKADCTIPAVKTVRLSSTSYTYNGKVRTPSVGVYDAKGTKLVKDRDYTVTYASGRKNVGAYKVTIKGKGDYSFTKTLTFKILPVKTAIRNLEGRDKSFFARWNKKTEQVTGYQLQYSLKRSFDSAKTKTIGKNTTLSATISKLKADKIYYVRIRTYKTVGGTKFYSSWSDPVRVRTQ